MGKGNPNGRPYVSPHPRDFECPRCKAKDGEYCVSKTGKKIIKYEKMHTGRLRVYDEAMLKRYKPS